MFMVFFVFMGANTYNGMLREGESVNMEPAERGSREWDHDCRFAPVGNNTHERGNSVVIDIVPGGSTEPVLITADITLTISVLSGSGRIVLCNSELGDEVVQVEIREGDAPFVLFIGDAYYYLNDGPDNLIIRDDSTPAFVDGDETLLTAKPEAGQQDGRAIKLPVAFWAGYATRK